VKNLIIPIFISALSLSFTAIPSIQANNNEIPVRAVSPVNRHTDDLSPLYDEMNLQEYGLSKEAFDYACKGYQKLIKQNLVNQTDYLTICDFSQSSKQKRLYILDMAEGKLVLNTYVAHGKNSGLEYATRFSNRSSSQQSSLGFYVTQNTYFGEHGLSLRLVGVDRGFNDKALRRHIVIHGADYIEEDWLRRSNYMGRSFGCPAVPGNESNTIINTIKNGTCLFIYHPNRNYLLKSKILNG
jgi:hypothetical protein